MTELFTDPVNKALFDQFCIEEQISGHAQEQFMRFAQLLLEWNEHINLTSITDVKSIIHYHFQDSLKVQHYVDFQALHTIADVGTGGGFPGIPLKIRFPHLKLILIEVSHKKIKFLEEVIQALNLSDIAIYDLDWRTFLRKIELPIELFCARASLSPLELIRMFQPSCAYRNAQLVYWASTHWQAEGKLLPYVQNEFFYSVGNRNEKFVVLKNVKKE